jgi:malate synthase
MTQRGLTLKAPTDVGAVDILDAPALALLAEIARAFRPRLFELLRARGKQGERFDFLPDTKHIREADWKVAPIPTDLRDRRVEITGPTDRKMILNALSSGAQVFMADFEDSNAPTWRNLIEGQRALREAVRGTLTFDDPATKKHYAMPAKPAVLLARPRGLHLPESHLLVDGTPIPGSFFDAALYVLGNAKTLLDRGSGPYFYLPKMESHKEAALWADVLALLEQRVGIPKGSIKVTVLIETLPAAFEMDEILFALKDNIVGLNCGRWDYIFSTIKRRRGGVMPDRAQITMEQHSMRSYAQLLIKTCHRRGAFAMGGMSAFIPRKDDAEANERALEKVRADKRREAGDGHDGTWVAHPGLVSIAAEQFTKQNQLDVKRDDVNVTAADLLQVPLGDRTELGLRTNARVGVAYLSAWLKGQGCVPIDHLMEDAATAEISRTQIWQWLHAGVEVGGVPLTEKRLREVIVEEARGQSERARDLFLSLCLKPELEEFLTLPAYELLVESESKT